MSMPQGVGTLQLRNERSSFFGIPLLFYFNFNFHHTQIKQTKKTKGKLMSKWRGSPVMKTMQPFSTEFIKCAHLHIFDL